MRIQLASWLEFSNLPEEEVAKRKPQCKLAIHSVPFLMPV